MMKKNLLHVVLLALLAFTLFGQQTLAAEDDKADKADEKPDEKDAAADGKAKDGDDAGADGEEAKPDDTPATWEIDQSNYDAEFYFHDIPDLVNKNETEFWFRLTNKFLTGVKRGLFDDNKIELNDRCFGPYYQKKLNEYAYLFWANPFGNFFENMFPELALSYEFYYMIWSTCDIDDSINEYMMFCWYKGCWPEKMFWDSWE